MSNQQPNPMRSAMIGLGYPPCRKCALVSQEVRAIIIADCAVVELCPRCHDKAYAAVLEMPEYNNLLQMASTYRRHDHDVQGFFCGYVEDDARGYLDARLSMRSAFLRWLEPVTPSSPREEALR